MTYSITKEIRVHHEDGWFFQFTDDSDVGVEISYYETHGIHEEIKGEPFRIPKDCLETFISVLQELK